MKQEIEALYFEDEYRNREPAPYKAYLHALEQVFDLGAIDAFCDAGCSAGGLLSALRQRYPRMVLKGIDYFEWARKYADSAIAREIEVADLSIPYEAGQQFDIVNSTEVGEHISPESESIFIENLLRMTRDILVLGWSEDKVEGNHQHLNPRPREYIQAQVVARGFDIWIEATQDLREHMRLEVKYGAYYWWSKPVTVYRRRRYLSLHPKRFVQGTATDGAVADLKRSFPGRSLQKQVMALRNLILLSVAKREPLSILRFGDGDLYFVNAIPIGSARPGYRALRIEYHQKANLAACRLGLFRADVVTAEIGTMMEGGLRLMLLLEWLYRWMPDLHRSTWWRPSLFLKVVNRLLQVFAKAFRSYALRLLTFPLLAYLRHRLRLTPAQYPILRPLPYTIEAVYALVASRILFRLFPSEILLVGQKQKLDAIQELVKYEAYRRYLGIEGFCGYVGVEKIGAADNEETILTALRVECERSQPKLILLGIGSAKLYVLPRIRSFSDAVVVDVGAGIDALAGVISHDRPYFADWVNFKSDAIDYASMDMMDATNPRRDADKYRKVVLAAADRDAEPVLPPGAAMS